MAEVSGPLAAADGDSGPIWLRPDGSDSGRPARFTRARITVAAVQVGDQGGLAAVTMRSVAAALGTGAGSLYRHVRSRVELIDLMVDHVAGEYALGSPTGDWALDLAEVVEQGLAIHHRHPWLVDVATAPVPGPNGVRFIEHVLEVLVEHSAPDARKLVAMAVMNALITAFARHDSVGRDAARAIDQARYLSAVVTPQTHPRLAALSAPASASGAEAFPSIVVAAVAGLLDSDTGV